MKSTVFEKIILPKTLPASTERSWGSGKWKEGYLLLKFYRQEASDRMTGPPRHATSIDDWNEEHRGRRGAPESYLQALKIFKRRLAFPWHHFKITTEQGILCTYTVTVSEQKCLHLLSCLLHHCSWVGGKTDNLSLESYRSMRSLIFSWTCFRW